jgi:hypothetical protein
VAALLAFSLLGIPPRWQNEPAVLKITETIAAKYEPLAGILTVREEIASPKPRLKIACL